MPWRALNDLGIAPDAQGHLYTALSALFDLALIMSVLCEVNGVERQDSM